MPTYDSIHKRATFGILYPSNDLEFNNNDLSKQIQCKLPNRIKVFGHFSVYNEGIMIHRHNICVDTGSGLKYGYLSGIELPEGTVINAPNKAIPFSR